MPDDRHLDTATPRADTSADKAADDTARPAALREAARLKTDGDVFLVKTDLEDQDQREAAPGTRDQP